jgi:hypothetical protein
LTGRRNDIARAEFPGDFLETDVDGVVVEFGLGDVAHHGDGKTGDLDLLTGITPTGLALARF